MKILTDLKVPLGGEESLRRAVARKLGVKTENLGEIRYVKKSLDARKKNDVHYLCTVEVAKKGERLPKIERKLPEKVVWDRDPVAIAGAGPCGLFAALRLAEAGVPVLLFERGEDVDARKKTNERFLSTRVLDEESNVQFGEGGAGTFSDGKLTTQIKSPYVTEILQTFVGFGAPEEILWEHKPHVGSDRLPAVVKGIRSRIDSLGGKVFFRTKVEDFSVTNGSVTGILAGGKKYDVSALVLAVGHSARDTFYKMYEKKVAMCQKPFAVGFRVEHPQSLVSAAQYGEAAELLPPADYKLTASASGRGVYTFCMCPGGTVVAAASETGLLAVNGMSDYARDGENANSALLAQVTAKDFGGEGVFDGLAYQRKLERAAFLLGGGDYTAPAMRMEDFLAGRETKGFGSVKPTYPLGVKGCDLASLIGEEIAGAIREGALAMDRRLKGFAFPDAVLTGVETRTSSPVRILRGEDLQSVSFAGLYPAGEGAGYAGGIVSAAADGLKVADRILSSAAKRG